MRGERKSRVASVYQHQEQSRILAADCCTLR
jgi:hypothetical protein